jgi:hypothetical protein
MALKNCNSDYIKDPYRSELLKRLVGPKESCPAYDHCSDHGQITRVYCELQPKTRHELERSISRLFDLSNIDDWDLLRGAIRELDSVQALTLCLLMSAFIAIKGKVRNNLNLTKANNYEPAWEYGAKRIDGAIKAIEELEEKISTAEARRPEVSQVKNFTECKGALCDLVACGLEALKELYEIERKAVSPKVLKAIHKKLFGMDVEAMLHPASRINGKRYWEEIQILLCGIEEIETIPDRSKWSKAPDIRRMNGDLLQQDVKKMAAIDESVLKEWFDLTAPGLYEHMQSASDQVAVLLEAMNRAPHFPPTLSHMVQVAFLHRADLIKLRGEK